MMVCGSITEWNDIPMELLMNILSLLDDRTVIIASAVCTGWRDTICQQLTHISLSWCTNNINNLVFYLAPKFTKLTHLTLCQNNNPSPPLIDDNAVEAIANYCHDLQHLDLTKSVKLTDRSLYALARGCPKLTNLNISHCRAFTDSALEFLATYCRNLKILNLRWSFRAATNKSLKAIGSNCQQLESINLGWCKEVGSAGVMSLAYGCPNLRAIDLSYCVSIKDKSVIALANNCLGLRSLSLYGCRKITDRAMYALADSRVRSKHVEGLTNLNVDWILALTAPAVQAVCNSFPELHTCPDKRSLILSYFWKLESVHCVCAHVLSS